MRHSLQATRGMAVAPHALASQSALAVLRDGGNAVEAMIAAAATISVAYPHMNSIGGDGFWTISVPGQAPRGHRGRRHGGRHRLARLLPIARPRHDPASRPAGRQHGGRHDLRLGRRLCLCQRNRRQAAALAAAQRCHPLCPRGRARHGIAGGKHAQKTRRADRPAGFPGDLYRGRPGPGGRCALPPAATGRNPRTPRRRRAGFLLPRRPGAGHRGGSGSSRQPGQRTGSRRPTALGA